MLLKKKKKKNMPKLDEFVCQTEKIEGKREREKERRELGIGRGRDRD